MTHVFHTRLRPGTEATYDTEHAEIPAELARAMRSAGIREWRIWRDGVDVFQLVEADDFERAIVEINESGIAREWSAAIAELIDVDVDASTGAGVAHPVWCL